MKTPECDNDAVNTPKVFPIAPDGGWGWVVVTAGFFNLFIIDGVQYSFGNKMNSIKKAFPELEVTEISLLPSLFAGFLNFSGPVGSALGNQFGFRRISVGFSLVAAAGLALTAYAPVIYLMYVTYGLLAGFGSGIVYLSTTITVTQYFDRWRAVAVGIIFCGCGIGMFSFAHLTSWVSESYGHSAAFQVDAGIALLMALMSLTFRKVDHRCERKRPRSCSLYCVATPANTTYRNSLYNPMFPTVKEGILAQSDSSMSLSGSSGLLLKRARRLLSQIPNPEDEEEISKKRCCACCHCKRSCYPCGRCKSCYLCSRCQCCYSCCYCCRKKKPKTFIFIAGDRPLYRDDVFYGGSVNKLKQYQDAKTRMDYHLSVTRMPGQREVREALRPKCCRCNQAMLRPLVTMLNFKLFKDIVFIFFCMSNFLFILSVQTCMIFGSKRAEDAGIGKETSPWITSTIGFGNSFGRLMSGLIGSLKCVSPSVAVLVSLLLCGIFTAAGVFTSNFICQFVFAGLFGVFAGPSVALRPSVLVELYGLEKLTNAFGLTLLVQGFAALMGTTTAGLLYDYTGTFEVTYIVCGSCLVFSSFLMLIAYIVYRKRRLRLP